MYVYIYTYVYIYIYIYTHLHASIILHIGAGGMGTIFKGRCNKTGVDFAIKR